MLPDSDDVARETETVYTGIRGLCMQALQPTGLMINLLRYPERTTISTPAPRFSWIVNASEPSAVQYGAQILVASDPAILAENRGDLWDSGVPDVHSAWKIDSQSVGVEYAGTPLRSNTRYCWKVRTWVSSIDVSPWSEVQFFITGTLSDSFGPDFYLPVVERVSPVAFVSSAPGAYFIDFGRAAFGTVELSVDAPEGIDVVFHLGEVKKGSVSIDRAPGGSRRYRSIQVHLPKGERTVRVEIPPDPRNTGPYAVRMPEELFEVMPFRYCEIEGAPATLTRNDVVQLCLHYPFDEAASHFVSSNAVLNDVWRVCRYSIKATSFVGYYVDGDRERIPYESDGYITQLSHYGCDREYTLARRTLDHLINAPTWPTEWHLYLVLAAWNDYMFTGDDRFVSARYDDLVHKSLVSLAREDGLVSVERMTDDTLAAIHFTGTAVDTFKRGVRDIVDWPEIERDGHEMCAVNSVVNALHYRALRCLSELAHATGRPQDSARFRSRADAVRRAFNSCLVDSGTGLVVDGEGSSHSSLHANAFAVACGVLDKGTLPAVLSHIRSRGMACSVYASQMLLEALYAAGEDEHALSLLTATGMRSWAHMIYDVGTTITMEAWDDSIKPNQDWNHAWGAAPANAIPFGLMGVRPLKPGFSEVMIDPKMGTLSWADATIPTVRGPIHVRVTNEPNSPYLVEVGIPSNVTACVRVPADTSGQLIVDGRVSHARTVDGRRYITGIGGGRHTITSQTYRSA